MQIIKGNLFDSKDDLILATCNSFIKRNGELVMGRGAARQMKDLWPECAYYFGSMIRDGFYPKWKDQFSVYGVLTAGRFGVFQVKTHFANDAELKLIANSVETLNVMLANELQGSTVSVNFPGIGWGRLNESDVLPIISQLPDSVTIYKYV